MNYGNSIPSSCRKSSDLCGFKCCGSDPLQLDPIYPASTNQEKRRKSLGKSKELKKSTIAGPKPSVQKKKKSSLCQTLDDCGPRNQRSKASNLKNKNDSKKSDCHPNDCCCVDCDMDDHLAEVVKKGPKLSKTSKKQESLSMVNPKVDKVLKNYMYDNPELKETNSKKECVKLYEDLESSSDNEIWLLQCPKNFDPQQMLCRELGKQTKMECSADKFTEKKTLVVIVPQKAAEYGLLCDSLQLVKPVGKIVFSEKFGADDEDEIPAKKRTTASDKQSLRSRNISQCSNSSEESSADNSSVDDRDMSEAELESKPFGKKLSKKLIDQKFTIETTVTVEKCDRKKSKKSTEDRCLPLVPPEPTPLKKRKSK